MNLTSRNIVAEAHQVYNDFAAQLSDTQRTTDGQFEPYSAWSARDVLSHVSFWNERTAERTDAIMRGVPGPVEETDDILNDRAYQERQHWTWDAVWTRLNDAVDRLGAIADTMPEDIFAKNNEGNALINRIYNNLIWHSGWHMADYWLAQGERERADSLQSSMIERSDRLLGTEGHSDAAYNMACYYAKTGAKADALNWLREAAPYSPQRQEWARKDPDLAPLHGNPEFEAAITRTE